MDSTTQDLFVKYNGQVVPRSFNAGFITLSFAVSLIGAASTLELLNRRTSPKGKFNHLLLVSSAVTMGGIAIWCMHFIGNRAIDLANGEPELQIAYSSGFTALSFFVPIAVLLAAFVAVGINNTVSRWRVSVGGVLAGAAICGMHYLGNNSIDNYICTYNPVNVIGAALIAVAASIIALALFFVFRAAWTTCWWKRAACSVVLAGAVSGMHWCAAIGTEYRLVRLNTGSTQVSRNTTVIVVIFLSIGACFVMAGTAIYTARIMRRYASKAQQVVLAAAVFDKHNRILVNPDGLVPTEKITDAFLEKNASDSSFTIAHPVFLWMFQASRNWSGISPLVGAMANHLGQLPKQTGHSDRDSRIGIELINDHGGLIDNYDVIFRELFCVAAAGLAEKMKDHLTSVGMLWDEILPTGSSGERFDFDTCGSNIHHNDAGSILRHDGAARKESTMSVAARKQSTMSVAARKQSTMTLAGRKESTSIDHINLAEKGFARRGSLPEFGRGSLMFLVRRVNSEREIQKLEAAGYRFAELRQVSSIIGSSMQIKSADLESKLQNMAAYAKDDNRLQPGVHMGFFGIRARVGTYGFDVAVRQGARNLLPSVQLPIDRIEPWHLDFLRQLGGRLTTLAMAKKLASLRNLDTREAHFAAQLTGGLDALRAEIDDPIFNEAVLASTVVNLPPTQGAILPTSLITFHLLIPIHVSFTSPKCEYVPLNFFKVHQLVARDTVHHLAFTQSVHRELAPVLQPGSLEKSRSSRHESRKSRSPSRVHWLGGRLAGLGSSLPVMQSQDVGSILPTTARNNYNGSVCPLKKSGGFHRDSDATLLDTVAADPNPPPSYSTLDTVSQASPFGGIMVSEEIHVEISTAANEAARSTPPQRQTPAAAGKRISENPANPRGSFGGAEPAAAAAREDVGSSGANSGPIEMRMLQMAEVRTNVHAGGGNQRSNLGVDKVNDVPTFVDQLFTIAIESR